MVFCMASKMAKLAWANGWIPDGDRYLSWARNGKVDAQAEHLNLGFPPGGRGRRFEG